MSYASTINTKRACFSMKTSDRQKRKTKRHLLLQCHRGSGRDPAPPAACTGSVAPPPEAALRSPLQQRSPLCSKEANGICLTEICREHDFIQEKQFSGQTASVE